MGKAQFGPTVAADAAVSPQLEQSVTDSSSSPDENPHVELKDPTLAAVLAWLLPGLGHLYQGRTGKAILFFVCIMGTFVYGLYLGGNSRVGYGRVVYLSFTDEDQRLPFLCQIGIGLPAMPAVIQASRVRSGKTVLLGGFMAPPRGPNDPNAGGQPSLDELNKELDHYFELGTVYTMIAGLLNVLAVYDAWGGPVFAAPPKKEDEDEDGEEDEPASGPGSEADNPQPAETER